MSRRVEVAIVGGGPAGSSLAIALGRRGVPVVLFEKARHPRLKPCGEGLLPPGVRALERLTGLPEAPRVRGLRFAAGGASVDADFQSGPGLVVRRDRFDAWLFELAAATPHVEVRPHTPYRGEPADLVVGADGVHSMFHRRLPGRLARRRRVGLSTHVAGLEGLTDRVEVYFHDEGELYIAPTGDGEALVSALFDYRHFRRDGLTHLMTKTPALRARARRIEFTTPLLASGPLGIDLPRVVDPVGRLMLVGDAAGTPDPITAGGLSLLLTATELAADAIVDGDLLRYQRERLRLGRTYQRLARLLLCLGRTERRATFVLRELSPLVPRLLERALRSESPAASASCGVAGVERRPSTVE